MKTDSIEIWSFFCGERFSLFTMKTDSIETSAYFQGQKKNARSVWEGFFLPKSGYGTSLCLPICVPKNSHFPPKSPAAATPKSPKSFPSPFGEKESSQLQKNAGSADGDDGSDGGLRKNPPKIQPDL